MNNINILVVEDESNMRSLIAKYLTREDYIVFESEDGKKALEIFETKHLDLIILDIMLPNVDGWSVLRQIRKTSSVPVIMLSARGEEYDKLFGFELGVDDYVVKPFSPKELIARVKALLKRSKPNNPTSTDNPIIKFNSLSINPISNEIFIDSEEIKLTPKEFDLLMFLCKNKEILLTREQLLNQVWGYDFFGDLRTVDTHIKQLREKLKHERDLIKTVWGKGYKLKAGD